MNSTFIDMVVIVRPIGLGWIYNAKKGVLAHNKKFVEDDRHISDMERIQVTVDTPEKNPDRKMLVLDLKLWMDETEDCPQIRYTFYKKPITSKYTIMKRSAIAERVKKATIFQEALRRLSNTSKELP